MALKGETLLKEEDQYKLEVMRTKDVSFKNAEGIVLSGKMEFPVDRKPRYYALFAHCFTCGKDLRAARNLSLALTQSGFAVLRFDFTGLGESDGEFENTNFTSNAEDLKSACAFMAENYESPGLLVGHSLGGTAALQVASTLQSVKAVASIGAPFDPDHVLNLFAEHLDSIHEGGAVKINIGGRPFKIKRQFIKDVENGEINKSLNSDAMRGKSVLVLHSPQDQTVEIENAEKIYTSARHPKSYISLDGADHLLSSKDDSLYVGKVIAAWAGRYLNKSHVEDSSEEMVMARIDEGPFVTQILAGSHHMLADEPKKVGGDNLGPTPYEFLAAGLGACTAMTLKMYADRKKWSLDEVSVHLNYENKYIDDAQNCEEDDQRIGRFKRLLEISGDLDDNQRSKLLEIANKCPVHKTLERGVHVHTKMKG